MAKSGRSSSQAACCVEHITCLCDCFFDDKFCKLRRPRKGASYGIFVPCAESSLALHKHMSLWSHACSHSVYGSNTLEGCKQAVENGFAGIEVDAQYHGGHFYLHHDHWSLSNETLQQLLELNLTANLWIDLKTSDVNSMHRLISLVSDFQHRLIVEVYDQNLLPALHSANITVARLGTFHVVDPWEYIFYAVKTPCATWNLHMFCLEDMFLADGGDIAMTRFERPWHCDVYFPGRCVFYIVLLTLWLVLMYGTFRIIRRAR